MYIFSNSYLHLYLWGLRIIFSVFMCLRARVVFVYQLFGLCLVGRSLLLEFLTDYAAVFPSCI